MLKESTGPGYHVAREGLLAKFPQQCRVINCVVGTLDVQGNSHTPASCLQGQRSARNKAPQCKLGGASLTKALLAVAQEATGLQDITHAVLHKALHDLAQDTQQGNRSVALCCMQVGTRFWDR